jgi:hypothetical protein
VGWERSTEVNRSQWKSTEINRSQQAHREELDVQTHRGLGEGLREVRSQQKSTEVNGSQQKSTGAPRREALDVLTHRGLVNRSTNIQRAFKEH